MDIIRIPDNPDFNLNMEAFKTTTPAHADVFNNKFQQVLGNEKSITEPQFDDTGIVSGINSFPDFLDRYKSKNKLFTWFRDLKAGLKFVLHAGQIVNNCVTNRSDLPLSAAQGKALMDAVTTLNSELSKIGNTVSGVLMPNIVLTPSTSVNIAKIILPPGIWLLLLSTWIPAGMASFTISFPGASFNTKNDGIGNLSLTGYATTSQETTLYVDCTSFGSPANSNDFVGFTFTGIQIK